MRKRKIYYLDFKYKGSNKDILIESYTIQGAVSILREYYDIPLKDILIKKQATQEDFQNIPDKRIMVCSHMMIPLSSRVNK